MKALINFYSLSKNDISSFLSSFYNKTISLSNEFKHSISFENPIEMIDLISTFFENNDKYNINLWISIDKGIFINITEQNYDDFIRYIYERFPY